MGIGLATGILSGLFGVGSGILANQQHRKFADYLGNLKYNMPSAMSSAEAEYRGLAGHGLAGKETIKDDIVSQLARTMGLGKQVAKNPSELLDLLSKTEDSVTSNLRQLGIQDETAKLSNRMRLAEFLSRVKAPMEASIEDKMINLGISKEREKMVGIQELLKGISGGLEGVSQGVMFKLMEDYIKNRGTTWESSVRGEERMFNPFFNPYKEDYFPIMNLGTPSVLDKYGLT